MPSPKANANGKPAGTQPVGSGPYTVAEGDCLSSIAEQTGHFWETIWNDPANANLKREREDPNILLPGDRLTIPPLRLKEESHDPDKRHRFRRRGVPSKLSLQLLKRGKPRANEAYRLDVDGVMSTGKTDQNGYVTVEISGQAKTATLFVGEGDDEEQYELNLGHIYPISHLVGVKQRLKNLGFFRGELDETWSSIIEAALYEFQSAHKLKATGQLDEKTRKQLKQVHGS